MFNAPGRRQNRIAENNRGPSPMLSKTIHGHDTAPTFFWGKLACQGCVQNSACGLILMGDWRDSGFTRVGSQCIEETDVMKKLGTGAVSELT